MTPSTRSDESDRAGESARDREGDAAVMGAGGERERSTWRCVGGGWGVQSIL